MKNLEIKAIALSLNKWMCEGCSTKEVIGYSLFPIPGYPESRIKSELSFISWASQWSMGFCQFNSTFDGGVEIFDLSKIEWSNQIDQLTRMSKYGSAADVIMWSEDHIILFANLDLEYWLIGFKSLKPQMYSRIFSAIKSVYIDNANYLSASSEINGYIREFYSHD